MPQSFDPALNRTPRNPVHSAVANVRTDANRVENAEDTVDETEALSLVQLAIRRCGLKQDYLARRAHIPPSQLSSALNGHGAFNLRWMWHWPPEFWREYLALVSPAKASTPEALKEQRREAALRLIELLFQEAAA